MKSPVLWLPLESIRPPSSILELGRSIFTDATLVTLCYTLSKQLEIETTTGTESGVTLFYRIEFRESKEEI